MSVEGESLAPEQTAQEATASDSSGVALAYKTSRGRMFRSTAEVFERSRQAKPYKKQIQLIVTSPPFPLNRKKKYGNLQGQEYIKWLSDFGPMFREFLKEDGSIVLEMGNAWEPGEPEMSTLALEAMLAFVKEGGFHLCQQFICYNPARLPSPAQWVNIERIRVKDAYTHVWWMAPTTRPKADNRRILKPYSASMEKLLRTGKYNHGKRPSQHAIGETSFLTNNQGAIPPNVLTLTNTNASDDYLRRCREKGLQPHPARMPADLAAFFINFLTEARDLVFDPFAGSNTTGAVAEQLKRRWLAVEPNADYIAASRGRFEEERLS